MNWKILLGLFIIIAITGLLIFSERGKNIRESLGKYLKPISTPISGYFKGITGKFIKSKAVNRTLDLQISLDSINLRGQEFTLNGNSFEGTIKLGVVSIGEQNINLKESSEANFVINGIKGTILFDTTGEIKISGEANSIELNGMLFTSKIENNKQTPVVFLISGIPVTFSIDGIEKDRMILSEVKGVLRLADWSPLDLNNDNLDISNFLGSIQKDEESVVISGKSGEVILNGVSLALKK
jgi:hypothetical protein